MLEFNGINSFLVGMSSILLKDGRKREVRGEVCYELPYPLLIKISNPKARLVIIGERGWNPVLPYIESLWLGLGRNDLAMPSHYLKRLETFSDDKITLRAAYGPRFRYWQGGYNDYTILDERSTNDNYTDQFKYVLDVLNKDLKSRQAIISIGDPAKDCFDVVGKLKNTLDRPCTRDVQFMVNNSKLDTYVHMRSNDFVWGATAVNIFNFTFLQEIFAGILKLEVGSYYHMANNFHYYERHKTKVESLSKIKGFEDNTYTYKNTFRSLKDYDKNLKELEDYEVSLRNKGVIKKFESDHDFMSDWANVIYSHYVPKDKSLSFINPILNEIIKNKIR